MTYQDKDVTNKIIMYNRNANAIISYFKYLNGHLRVHIMQVVVETTTRDLCLPPVRDILLPLARHQI